LVLGAVVACENKPEASKPPSETPASPASIAAALGIDAAALAPPIDPPPPAGDLKVELERFTTVEQCVRERAGTIDPLVGDGLHAIGYDTFLRDACTMLEASKLKDKKKCGAIDATSLRVRCETMVAMVSNQPDECPWDVPDLPARGRASTCVAVAARDPRLCVTEPRFGKVQCEAIASRDDKKCASLPEGERAACRREVERFKNVLEPAIAAPALAAPAGKLTIEPIEGTPEPQSKNADVTIDVARGVVLVGGVDRASFELGYARGPGGAAFLAPMPAARTRFAAKVSVARDVTSARLDSFELDVPGAGTISVPGARSDLKLVVTKLERARGAEVAFSIEGAVGVAPRAYKIKLDATTFVRDVVSDLAAAKAGGRPTSPGTPAVPALPRATGASGR
jgi:hypothetical protein